MYKNRFSDVRWQVRESRDQYEQSSTVFQLSFVGLKMSTIQLHLLRIISTIISGPLVKDSLSKTAVSFALISWKLTSCWKWIPVVEKSISREIGNNERNRVRCLRTQRARVSVSCRLTIVDVCVPLWFYYISLNFVENDLIADQPSSRFQKLRDYGDFISNEVLMCEEKERNIL